MKMRALVLTGLILAAWTARAQAQPHSSAMADEPVIFSMIRTEVDATDTKTGSLANWDVDGWIGGDTDKLWLRSEGTIRDGAVDDAEMQALWSRNISTFWDFQAGLRQDFQPHGRSYATFGVEGLAPLFFETAAHAFISTKGDVTARLIQSIDLPITQRLILEPHAEINLAAQDVRDQRIGAGLSSAEVGLQLRYEIVRKIAPYIDLVWQRRFAKTADFARAAGEPVEETTLRAGIRVWF